MPRGRRDTHGWPTQPKENQKGPETSILEGDHGAEKTYVGFMRGHWVSGLTKQEFDSSDSTQVQETHRTPAWQPTRWSLYHRRPNVSSSSFEKTVGPETSILEEVRGAKKVHMRSPYKSDPWVSGKAKEEFHRSNSTQVQETHGTPTWDPTRSHISNSTQVEGTLPGTTARPASNLASSSKLSQPAPRHGQNNAPVGASVPQNISQPLEVASNSSGLPNAKPSDTTVLRLPTSHSLLNQTELVQGGITCSSMMNSEHQTSNISTACSERQSALSLLPFLGLGVKVEGSPMKMPAPTSPPVPSLLAMFQRLSEQSPSSFDNEGTAKVISGELLDELRRLRLEVDRERHQRLGTEQQLEQEREDWERERQTLMNEREGLEREVQNGREEREQQSRDLQSRLQAQEHQINELTTTVTSTQRALDENRRSQTRDWVISRDEVRMSDKSLGVGGWGRVVEGWFRGTKVAVKQIHELILSPLNRRLFEREMNIASRCRHPCLLQFIGATNDDASPLFVTELMEKSLRAVLQERSLSRREILLVSSDVARALNYLHLNRPTPIIHRDISSANVLLWRQGETWRGKVSDYGTANFVHQTMTKAPGAPPYSAPEAVTSAQSPKLDVYSFGVLLCEMNTRELPVPQQKEEQIALVTNHVLRDLIRRCVEPSPEARLTMEEILNELETLYEAEGNYNQR